MTLPPAVICVWDESAGSYAVAEGARCAALWKTTTAYHLAESVCGNRAVDWLGDVPLCAHHMRRIGDAIHRYNVAERERWARAAEQSRAKRMANSVVYFVERDGFVKIGTTIRLAERLKALSRGDCAIDGLTPGPVELLATMSGDVSAESELHERFAHLRIGGEWFLPDDELRAFIAELATKMSRV